VLIPVWSQVAVHYTHIDDALAMAFGVLALRDLVARRPMMMALALAAAADAKPWALGFDDLLAELPARHRRRAALTTAAAVAAMRLPFGRLLATSQAVEVSPRTSLSNRRTASSTPPYELATAPMPAYTGVKMDMGSSDSLTLATVVRGEAAVSAVLTRMGLRSHLGPLVAIPGPAKARHIAAKVAGCCHGSAAPSYARICRVEGGYARPDLPR